MTKDDRPRFFQGLNDMAELFTDAMTEHRQKLYWQLFESTITLDEWQHGCHEAMRQETFYKVPLPGHLWEYISAYRDKKHQNAMLEERQRQEKQRMLAETHLRELQNSPEYQARKARNDHELDEWFKTEYPKFRQKLGLAPRESEPVAPTNPALTQLMD